MCSASSRKRDETCVHGNTLVRDSFVGKCTTGSGRPLDGRTWTRTSPQHGTATREDQVWKVASLESGWGLILRWSPRHTRNSLEIPRGYGKIYQRTIERHQISNENDVSRQERTSHRRGNFCVHLARISFTSNRQRLLRRETVSELFPFPSMTS